MPRDVSEKSKRSLTGDRKSGLDSASKPQPRRVAAPSMHSGHLETTVPRMPYSNFRDRVSRTPEVVEKAEAPESHRLLVSPWVSRRHGEATTPEGQDVSWQHLWSQLIAILRVISSRKLSSCRRGVVPRAASAATGLVPVWGLPHLLPFCPGLGCLPRADSPLRPSSRLLVYTQATV